MARKVQGCHSSRRWGSGGIAGLVLVAAAVVLAWSSGPGAPVVQAQETPTPTETSIPGAMATAVVPPPTEAPPPVEETPAPERPTPPPVTPVIEETPGPDIVIAPPPIAPAPPGAREETLPATGSGPASGGGNMARTLTLVLGLAGGVLLASGTAGLWVRRVR